MKLWFNNGLFIESGFFPEIRTTLRTYFNKGVKLKYANNSELYNIISCILSATDFIDDSFITDITKALKEERQELIEAENKLFEMKKPELSIQDLKELQALVTRSLNEEPNYEQHAARLELINNKLETIINRG